MKQLEIMYADDDILERIYEAKVLRKRYCSLHRNADAEPAIPPMSAGDAEERLSSGFRIFEMAETGYPKD